jgi:hypothetical protein
MSYRKYFKKHEFASGRNTKSVMKARDKSRAPKDRQRIASAEYQRHDGVEAGI